MDIPDRHPVLDKIDRDQPYFSRTVVWRKDGEERECVIQLWLPVQLDNGGWVCAVHATGLDLPPISAMPGEDPLDALLASVGFVRSVLEERGGSFLYGARSRQMGGLPVSLNRGFSPDDLLQVEAEAYDIALSKANEQMKARMGDSFVDMERRWPRL